MMKQSNIKRVAIIAGLSECLIYADARYCAFDIGGNPKYYVCPKSEYCCNFGCCVSPGFQIYHLWYYWLLVIIMFLVCSGGGWWYRYWLQGRYRAAASVIPATNATPSARASNSRAHSIPQRGSLCQGQQASISYNSSRNTVFLHRMWKGPPRSTATPPYPPAPSHSAPYHAPNIVLNDLNCPYYQLYGPPPSYDSVIAQSRLKPHPPPPHPPPHPSNAQRCPLNYQEQLTCDFYQSQNNRNCHHSTNQDAPYLSIDRPEPISASELSPQHNVDNLHNCVTTSTINPSDNVILDALNNHSILFNLGGIAQINDQRPSTSSDSRAIVEVDTKHKLGRSKSLE